VGNGSGSCAEKRRPSFFVCIFLSPSISSSR
jgi:hypothetical protein